MKALILIFAMLSCSVECTEEKNEVEYRGKGLSIALLSHFLYVVATKVVILKIVYGALFFVLICKGWKYVLWFIHYLKQREQPHEYIEEHHFDHYNHHDHHDHFDHHDPYGSFDHQPYGYDSYGYESKKGVYDADGSYSVKRQ